MATQLEQAKKGIITKEMEIAAKYEGHITAEQLREKIAIGHAVIPKNINHNFTDIRAIGSGLKTKVNANIGTSGKHFNIEEEIEKLKVSLEYGADSVMDLSTGGNLREIRQRMLKESSVMLGTVPIYETMAKKDFRKEPLYSMTADEIFEDIEKQCKEGVDYITVHTGITKHSVEVMLDSERELGVVSRGGSVLASWIIKNGKENPLYEYYDRLLDIAYKYDVTLSLGDGFRPGSVVDATDRGQIEELITLGRLAKRARERNVQVMIEGPGHVPLNQIKTNVELQKSLCDGAPFYVLGPLTTDIAPGYDHITSSIGGAMAASFGVDFLCYVTPAEHLMLPNLDDVRKGVVAAKIAAHSGDIAKGIPEAIEKDRQMSAYRRDLNWEGMFSLALDPKEARDRKMASESGTEDVCTMCGELCAIKTFNDAVVGQKEAKQKLKTKELRI